MLLFGFDVNTFAGICRIRLSEFWFALGVGSATSERDELLVWTAVRHPRKTTKSDPRSGRNRPIIDKKTQVWRNISGAKGRTLAMVLKSLTKDKTFVQFRMLQAAKASAMPPASLRRRNLGGALKDPGGRLRRRLSGDKP